MDKKSRLAMILLGIVFPIIALITVSEGVIFDRNFFVDELSKNNVSVSTALSSEELDKVTDQIFAFLKGQREDFNLYIEKGNDLHMPLFTQDEVTHMEDVRGLLKNAVIIQAIGILIFVICFIGLFIKNKRSLAMGMGVGSIIGIITLAILGGLFMFDFTTAFVALHRVIFTNEFWYLDPAKSVLINLVPEPYFIDLALRIGFYAVVVFLITLLISSIGLRKTRCKEFMKNKKRKF
ncbi:MAG: TIGR01906 family membrane protein [Eubacterium sp.]